MRPEKSTQIEIVAPVARETVVFDGYAPVRVALGGISPGIEDTLWLRYGDAYSLLELGIRVRTGIIFDVSLILAKPECVSFEARSALALRAQHGWIKLSTETTATANQYEDISAEFQILLNDDSLTVLLGDADPDCCVRNIRVCALTQSAELAGFRIDNITRKEMLQVRRALQIPRR